MLADGHARKGGTQAAEQLFRSVLLKYPDNPRAIEGLKALKQSPSTPQGTGFTQAQAQNLVVLYNQGRLQEALDQAVNLEQSTP